MIDKYKGRMISTSLVISAIIIWDIIFYGLYDYQYHILIDSIYTILVLGLVWWLSSYYDKSRILLRNLRNSEEKYKELSDSTQYVFANLNQAVFQVDSEAKLTLLNPAWETLTGFYIHESLGHDLYSFLYLDDRSNLYKRAQDRLENKILTVQDEVRFRKKDGGFIWLEINSKINYDFFCNVESAVGTLTDITHWKSSESELIQLNENLSIHSEKMSVIAQMSAAIAHEVRNPLTSISGFIQLLKEQKELEPQYIEVIISEIDRINLVLSEMLLLSKPQVVNFNKVNLNIILDHVNALVSTEANMNNVSLTLSKPQYPIWVFGEENQLKQVIINIVKNAMEAMKSSGEIEILLDLHNEFVSIYIKDNGPGIPKELLDVIGQPFYTSKEKGTGLGLTICFKIIENHKGKIHICSELGVGTVFEIILPSLQETNE